MSKFAIAPCTLDDAPAIARNNMTAFWNDPALAMLWPKSRTLEYHIEQGTRRTPRNLLVEPDRRRHQKVIDTETGQLMGYARWELPKGMAEAWPEAHGPIATRQQYAEAEREFAAADWNYVKDNDDLDGPIIETKHRVMGAKTFLVLDYLAVHPENQGQGIASLLVQSGITAAESLGLDIFIHAKQAGIGVYTRLGFEVKDKFVQSAMVKRGGPEYTAFMLVREHGRRAVDSQHVSVA